MQKLPKDIVVLIALKLNLSDLKSFAFTEKKINALIFENKYFWILKSVQDFKKYANDDSKEFYRTMLSRKRLDRFGELMPQHKLHAFHRQSETGAKNF